MTKRILVYTMKGCGHCNNLKQKLDESKIPYINKDIDIYASEYEKVSKELNVDFIPIVKIEEQWLIPEKDFNSIDECVEKIKKLM